MAWAWLSESGRLGLANLVNTGSAGCLTLAGTVPLWPELARGVRGAEGQLFWNGPGQCAIISSAHWPFNKPANQPPNIHPSISQRITLGGLKLS